jgi:cyclic pyranopterin phosphate synthase
MDSNNNSVKAGFKSAPTFDALNRPLRDLRISVIDRCNFRCTYCMPSEKFHHAYQFLDREEWLTFEEIARLAQLFVASGVVKIRITGGEPLLRPEVSKLVKSMSALQGVEDLALTTNGSFLQDQAVHLFQAGLKRLTVSLDTLDEGISRQMNGERGSVAQILKGIHAAESAGFHSLKINTVVQRGVNDHTLVDLVKYFRGTPHVIRFIEYMDVGNQNHWDHKHVVPSKDIVAMIHREFPLKPLGANYDSEVASRYAYTDGKGEIGLISSVSEPFCGSCSRLRLSADGKMYSCLFATQATDLKRPMRSGATNKELYELIQSTWQARTDRYSQERSRLALQNKILNKVEMYQIGG